MKILFTAVSILLSAFAIAQTAPRLTRLGSHPVVFQGREVVYVAAHKLYKTRVVAKWDAETFEVADAYFKCTSSRCSLSKTISRAFYAQCARKNEAFACRGKIQLGSPAEDTSVRNDNSDTRVWGEEEPTRENTTYWDGGEDTRDGNWETDGIVLF